MAGARSLFIVLFLTVSYGCGVEDQAPADATPSVAGTVPIVFENTMLNGAWTSNCYVGAASDVPNNPGRVVFTFSPGSTLTEGEFSGWYEIYDETDIDCAGALIVVDDVSGTYSAGGLKTTDGGDQAFEIDITINPGDVANTELNIIRIINNQFFLGVGDPVNRPTGLNTDLVYTFLVDPPLKPVVFEHSMLNGTWTSTCAQGGVEFIPDVWGKFVLIFDNGVLSGSFVFFDNVNSTCAGVATDTVDIAADYTTGKSVQIGGLNAYEIDLVGKYFGGEVVWLDIIYIDGDTFQWGDLPIWTTVRPTAFDRQYLFRRN